MWEILCPHWINIFGRYFADQRVFGAQTDIHIPTYDLKRDPDLQNLLDSFQISANEIPVLICRGQLVSEIQEKTNRRLPRLQRVYRPDSGARSCCNLGLVPQVSRHKQSMAHLKDLIRPVRLLYFWRNQLNGCTCL